MAEDLSWVELREPWQRLRWARRQSPFQTARDAAASLGINEGTYSAYERSPDSSKHIPLSHQRAIEFGRKFKVRWEWLLTGEGGPALAEDDPQSRTIAGKIAKLPKEDQETVSNLIERLSRAGR